MNDIEKRIEELTNELNYHNHKYYVDDAPEISDFVFDKMLVELEQLEEKYPEYKKKNSPTVRVGGEAVKSFGEVHHDVPMLSQQKAFSKEEILDFDRRVKAVVHDVNSALCRCQLFCCLRECLNTIRCQSQIYNILSCICCCIACCTGLCVLDLVSVHDLGSLWIT